MAGSSHIFLLLIQRMTRVCGTALITLLLGLLIAGPVAGESPRGEYNSSRIVPHVSERFTEVQVSGKLNGNGFAFTGRSDDAATVVGWGRKILSYEEDLDRHVRQFVHNSINEYIRGATLRNWDFELSGPLKLRLAVTDSGLQARFGGVTARISAKIRYSSSLSWKFRLLFNPIWFEGSYDPVTGAVKLVVPEDLSVDLNIDVDAKPLATFSGLRCLLRVSSRVDLAACAAAILSPRASMVEPVMNAVQGELQKSIKNSISKFGSQEYVFWGLENAVDEIMLERGISLNKSEILGQVRKGLKLADGNYVALTISESLRHTGVLQTIPTACRFGRSVNFGGGISERIVEVKVTTSVKDLALTVRNGVEVEYSRECGVTTCHPRAAAQYWEPCESDPLAGALPPPLPRADTR